MRKINAFGRLVTVHPTGLPPLSGRALFKDQGLLDIDMLQTGHGGKEVLAPTIRTLRTSYEAKPTMPVVNGEVCYEALLGRTPAEVPRLMFWASVLSGAAGHTYGANGIWQLNRKDQPYGKSPHGGDYGHIPWDEAMKLPGSGQLGLAKRLLEKYPWQKFEPHPDWAAWNAVSGPAAGAGARDEFQVPYAAGVAGVVRVVYLPRATAVTVHRLEPDIHYTAYTFDPVSGRRAEVGPVRPDADGSWTASPPDGSEGDWVLVLEAPAAKP